MFDKGEDEIILIDKNNKQYTKHSILSGIARFSSCDIFGFDTGGGAGFSIGGGSRADVIRKLGFSDNPTKEECSAKMKTIDIEAYPGRRITVHQALVNDVQGIFRELKNAGVNLNKCIGGYFFRPINNPSYPGSKTLSMHSFGCAIDINYDLNPFVKNGTPLTTGDDTPNGKVRTMSSPIVRAFAKYGWGWGGRYGDYMHFSLANGG